MFWQVDVIVDSTSPNLKLASRPGLSQSLLEVAGQSLQDQCDEEYPDGIKPGELAVTDGYNLKCQRVYHGTLPGWYSKRSESLLPEKVRNVLNYHFFQGDRCVGGHACMWAGGIKFLWHFSKCF